jgi:tetratricopeptide (TPR) repeat protein
MRAKILAAGLMMALVPGLTQADNAAAPVLALGLCASGAADVAAAASPAPVNLKRGYGKAGWTIATTSPDAQAFFDNGLQLGHAFAHKAAVAAFEEAARRDPGCAMCLWGQAWAGGATINYDIDAKTQAKMAALMDRAATLAEKGSPLEREMIAAMKARYRHGGGKGPGDDAYAKAMDALARAHPDDNELAVLTADALMVPASLRESKAGLPRAVELLEATLKRDPDNAPAIHFYIHATEMSGFTARAEPYADKLEALAPAASHLVHMPSHTFYWVGRYEDALQSNIRAARIDEANAKAQGFTGDGAAFQLFYHGHNVQFGTAGALMVGDVDGGLSLARPAIAHGPRLKPDEAWNQMVVGAAYAFEGRYAPPDEVLALAEPGQPYLRAMWRYARAEALGRNGDVAGLRREAAQVELGKGQLKSFGGYAGQMAEATRLARLVLEGRAAMLADQPQAAARILRQAAELEEKHFAGMTDPPIWYPVRRSLAAALLASGDAQGAAREARVTLARRPADPVALNVLAQAERKLGQADAADQHLARARKTWMGDLSKVTLAQS